MFQFSVFPCSEKHRVRKGCHDAAGLIPCTFFVQLGAWESMARNEVGYPFVQI